MKTYPTSDLRVGAYLRTLGYKIASTRKDRSTVVFDFEDTDNRANDVRAFFNKETAVEPLGYMQSISEMRDMVSAVLREHEMTGGTKK